MALGAYLLIYGMQQLCSFIELLFLHCTVIPPMLQGPQGRSSPFTLVKLTLSAV